MIATPSGGKGTGAKSSRKRARDRAVERLTRQWAWVEEEKPSLQPREDQAVTAGQGKASLSLGKAVGALASGILQVDAVGGSSADQGRGGRGRERLKKRLRR
jgi:hypothetical protein